MKKVKKKVQSCFFLETGALSKQFLHNGKGGSTVIYDKAKGIDDR